MGGTADRDGVTGAQVQPDGGTRTSAARVEHRRGTGGQVDHHRGAVGQDELPAGMRHPPAGMRRAVLDPDEVTGCRVEYPQPAGVVERGIGGVDLHGERDGPTAYDQRRRIGGGEDAPSGVQGVQGLGAGEHVQPVTGSRYRGGRRTHLERRPVDPADRALGTVDGVRGRRLLYHAEPVARIGDPYLCGHLRRRAVEQGQLTDPGGGQPRRAGQQVRTFGRVPAVGTGHDHTRRQYHDRETGQSAPYPIPPQPHRRIPFDVLMCRSVSTARQPGYTPVVVDRWRVGAQTGTAVEGGRRAP